MTLIKQERPHVDLWEKVELVSDEDFPGAFYRARVQDFTEEGIVISKPEYAGGDGKLLTLRSQINVRVLRSDAMYQFAARMRMIQTPSGPMVLLYDLGELIRIQRRDFFRLNYNCRLQYALVTAEPKGINEYEWKNAEAIDISAGGMLFRLNEQLNVGDKLILALDNAHSMGLPRLTLSICCRIMRVDKENLAGVSFVKREEFGQYFTEDEISMIPEEACGFDGKTQTRVAKFIFDEQVKSRQRGQEE